MGLQWGTVEFTVAVADRDPGADLDGYEDIVEIGYESPSGVRPGAVQLLI
ncbi:hypothetical protein Aple_009120 [Acrocarpospora pleiomorpha]|uniref:Uncharacterized protein n=1 Tax=Acrocarpospora pleiomorpha TaxID=90975 RepID=A0A5M3X8J4_9ACTN|nr:hypothetical protein Aple_009120 [Acrocarpospora pleiomorpha]